MHRDLVVAFSRIIQKGFDISQVILDIFPASSAGGCATCDFNCVLSFLRLMTPLTLKMKKHCLESVPTVQARYLPRDTWQIPQGKNVGAC